MLSVSPFPRARSTEHHGHHQLRVRAPRHLSRDGEVLSMRSRAGEGLRCRGIFRYDEGDQGTEIPGIRSGRRLQRLEDPHEHR
jgi:hypothetical protein